MIANDDASQSGRTSPVVLVGLLSITLLILFLRSLSPDQVVASNDGPYGLLASANARVPEACTGWWLDLNTPGVQLPSAPLGVTTMLRVILGPLGFARFFVPISLLVMGLSAWFFCRSLNLSPVACLLAGLAAALNSSFFSATCWGVGSQVICFAMAMVAMGLLSNASAQGRLLRIVLAGVATGLGVAEGFDIGGIFSLLVAAYAMALALSRDDHPLIHRLASGAATVALVAVCALLTAGQTVETLVQTQIQGVSGTEQDAQTKRQRWDFATQWSLPKAETLTFAVPGLFGYRMDTPDGGNYWGTIGQEPSLTRWMEDGGQGQRPPGTMRFSGSGAYAGALVLLLAAWIIARSFDRKGSVLTGPHRRLVWFWAAVAVIGILLAWGRHAPFYQVLYALPYFSTIRNPIKFIPVVNTALVILFAFGVEGLLRVMAPQGTGEWQARFKRWWQGARVADRRFVIASGVLLGAAALAALMFASSRKGFEQYLQTVDFDPALAGQIAAHSLKEAGWALVRFAAALAAFVLILAGLLPGKRVFLAIAVLGTVLVADLALANRPWIIYWKLSHKYATNPVLESLRVKPYEQRVVIEPSWIPLMVNLPEGLDRAFQQLDGLYRIEWAQHHFQLFNIQSLDKVQMPRMPEDLAAFEAAVSFLGTPETLSRVVRQWELTSTRYVIGLSGMEELFDRQFDASRGRFRVAQRFAIVAKPTVTQPSKYEDLTVQPTTNGPFALIEFTGALPKAGLYTRWQVETNDDLTLQTLASPDFDPHQSVLVAQDIDSPAADAPTNAVVPVEFVSYAPKTLVLRASTDLPAVLLLNDRYDPDWTVTVDGKPAELLRCNYLMRGVRLEPGEHLIKFALRPSQTGLYLSLTALAAAVVLLGVLMFIRRHPTKPTDPSPGGPQSAVKAPSGDRGTSRKA